MSSKNELWANALDYIKEELSDIVFQEYFETSIVPLFIKNETFYLQVPNEGHKMLLETQYAVLVENAIKYYNNRKYIKVKFVVASANGGKFIEEEHSANEEIAATSMNVNNNYTMYNTSYIRFNPKYTFDSFVVGENNRFAHAACMAVAESPANKYNPLFIYGGVGLGKTHLMHAIAQYILKKNPTKKIILISSEQFTNEFIESIRKGNDKIQFKNKYRNADVLLIDDIQFLSNKEGTQEEFFHTFNALHGSNKQIIITSDRPPRELRALEDRLVSRFSYGLMCDISSPSYETRLAILREKVQEGKFDIDEKILNFIAENVEGNIRELEGILLKVSALSQFYKEPLSVEIVKNNLKDIIDVNDKKIDLDLITNVICEQYNVTKEDLLSKRRTKNIAFPRQICMYLARELTDNSLPNIGTYYGGRDHSTVIHGYDKIKQDMKKNSILEDEINKVIVKIKNQK